jgi:general secretion pathway protein C
VIVTESSDPWWSMTTLREAGQSQARLRRVGDTVAGKQVAFIGYNQRRMAPSVWLEGAGTFCQSTLLRGQARVTPPDPPLKVQKPSGAQLNVDRSVVSQALADPRSLMSSIRVVPEMKGGAIVGLRLFGIRPGSLLATLGLQSGDRLESINGFDVASPEKALEAYARLRTAERLNVRLSRSGKLVELTLNIH